MKNLLVTGGKGMVGSAINSDIKLEGFIKREDLLSWSIIHAT